MQQKLVHGVPFIAASMVSVRRVPQAVHVWQKGLTGWNLVLPFGCRFDWVSGSCSQGGDRMIEMAQTIICAVNRSPDKRSDMVRSQEAMLCDVPDDRDVVFSYTEGR